MKQQFMNKIHSISSTFRDKNGFKPWARKTLDTGVNHVVIAETRHTDTLEKRCS